MMDLFLKFSSVVFGANKIRQKKVVRKLWLIHQKLLKGIEDCLIFVSWMHKIPGVKWIISNFLLIIIFSYDEYHKMVP